MFSCFEGRSSLREIYKNSFHHQLDSYPDFQIYFFHWRTCTPKHRLVNQCFVKELEAMAAYKTLHFIHIMDHLKMENILC